MCDLHRPIKVCRRGRRKCHEQGSGGGPHRADIREACGSRPTADVVRVRPVGAKVHAVNQGVRGDDHTAVGHLQHCRVIPGTDIDQGGTGEAAAQCINDPKLTNVTQGLAPFDALGVAHTGPLRVPSGATREKGSLSLAERMLAMVTAYILIQTEVGRAAEVADQIAKISGVTLAENLIGAYDVIVRAEANSDDELGRFVVAQVQAVPGITRTLTCPVINL